MTKGKWEWGRTANDYHKSNPTVYNCSCNYNDRIGSTMKKWALFQWFKGKSIAIIHHFNKVETQAHINYCNISMLIHGINAHNGTELEANHMSINWWVHKQN